MCSNCNSEPTQNKEEVATHLFLVLNVLITASICVYMPIISLMTGSIQVMLLTGTVTLLALIGLSAMFGRLYAHRFTVEEKKRRATNILRVLEVSIIGFSLMIFLVPVLRLF